MFIGMEGNLLIMGQLSGWLAVWVLFTSKYIRFFLLKSVTVCIEWFQNIDRFFYLLKMQYLYMTFRMETLGYYKNIVGPKENSYLSLNVNA